MKIALLRVKRASYNRNLGPRFETSRLEDGCHGLELWAFGRLFTWIVGKPALVEAVVDGYRRARTYNAEQLAA